MVNIIQKLIPSPTKRRSGLKISGVKFIVAHDTGNDGSTAEQNASYYNSSANEMQASAHYFVDDKEIICVIPENEKAWHVRYDVPKDNQLYGKDANDCALGIELCFSSKNKFDNGLAYKNYVELMASLCRKYNLDPKKDIVGHYLLDPSRRSDPLNAFKFLPKTWDGFIADVSWWFENPTGSTGSPATVITPPSPIPDPVSNDALKDELRRKLTEIEAIIGKIQ